MARRTAVVPTLAAVAALVVAGCGAPTASPIADPIEILVQSATTLEDATSFHLELTLEGDVALGGLAGGLLPGASGSPGSSGGTIDIGGTTVEGDVDIEDQAVQLAFAVPALLNTTGELIVVDEAAYVKASLLGDKYQMFDGLDTGGILPGEPSPGASGSPEATDPAGELREQLEGLATPPEKLPDERCGDTDCYRVRVTMDTTEEGPVASLAPDLAANATVDVWVRKNDLHPAQLTLTADAGDQGNVTATIVLSDWDAAVDIQAPPEDQVEEGSFDLPGLMPSPTS